MLLVSESKLGNFVVGRWYVQIEVAENGTPILKDEDGNGINVWDYERHCLPDCWK